MKRSLLFVAIVLFAAACSKNKTVAKKMDGDWVNHKILHDDGSIWEGRTLYHFDKSSGDGKTFAGWKRYYGMEEDSIVAQGDYLVTGKGIQVVLRAEKNGMIDVDTARMEDIDKKSMVIRINDGIYYFNPYGGGK